MSKLILAGVAALFLSGCADQSTTPANGQRVHMRSAYCGSWWESSPPLFIPIYVAHYTRTTE